MFQIRHSVCALDCPDTCALSLRVDESGRATKLEGDSTHPVTQGFLCAKVARYLDRQYHPDRLLQPLRRIGPKGAGQFERITWDAALDEIAARLQNISDSTGPEAILPYSYAGTMGLLNGSGMDRRFFHRLGASRLDRTICSSAGGAALMLSQGAKLGMDAQDFAQSHFIIAWGANILDTNPHLWPFIVEARRKGARLVVIDPIATRTAKLADWHLAPNPGSDLALALGLAHVILRDRMADAAYLHDYAEDYAAFARLAADYTPERVAQWTDIPAADIVSLAHEYAGSKAAGIRVNYGVQRSERGGAAVRAIAALPVLTGAWAREGGGLQLTTSGAFELNRSYLERPDLQFVSPLKRQARLLNMSELGRVLTTTSIDPPVEALVVYNSNPAAIAPNQNQVLAGLRRENLFTVVLEHFQTDTADYADIVLPATTFLEHTDLYLAYGHYHLQLARPAVAPAGEARSNVEIFRQLASRMGFDGPEFHESEDDMMRGLLDTKSPYLQGISLERLETERSIRLNISKPFASGFKTRSGRFVFGSESLAYTPPLESRLGQANYPLELLTPKNGGSMNSTFGNMPSGRQRTDDLLMHPEDAASRSIEDGEAVRVFNARGRIILRVRVSTDVKPGVVAARTMPWNRDQDGGFGVNVLTSEQLTDIGGGPAFYSCLVEVAAHQNNAISNRGISS